MKQGTKAIVFWQWLQHEDRSETIRSASKASKIVVLDTFVKNGCTNNNIVYFYYLYILVFSYPFHITENFVRTHSIALL
jgi:hypothetical protein